MRICARYTYPPNTAAIAVTVGLLESTTYTQDRDFSPKV